LERVAVRENVTLDAAAVDERAVGRTEVLEPPASADVRDACVTLGDLSVRQMEVERTRSDRLRGSFAATDSYLRDPLKRTPQPACGWGPAFEDHEKMRGLPKK
jgi:hypothetical protein